MRILFLGSSGMIGRNFQNLNNPDNIEILYPSSRELDLLDAEKVKSYLIKKEPELIINCAAKVGGIKANIESPHDFFRINLQIGVNIIDGALKTGVKKILNVGSSCMYPKTFNRPIKETDLLSGHLEPTNEGYALAKVSVAKYCEYASKTYDMDYKTVIPCNLYGPFDKFDEKISHLVPAIIKKTYLAKKNNEESITIWGDGKARREFMYAGDFADFLNFSILNFDKLPRYLNVGLGIDHTVEEYYQTVARLMDFKGFFNYDLEAPTGMKRKLNDIKLLSDLGWRYSTDLEKGIERTIKYFEENEI